MELESLDSSAGFENPVKVEPDYASGYELPVKVDYQTGSCIDLASYLTRVLPQTGSGTDALSSLIAYIYVSEALKSAEASYSAEAITGIDEYTKRISSLLPKLRTVKAEDKVLSEDITVPRDILYTIAAWLVSKGNDIAKLSKAQEILRSIDLKAGGILLLEHRNKLADGLRLILESFTSRYKAKSDSSTGYESATVRDMTSLFTNLYIKNQSGTIYMNSGNVRWNWCPSAWSSAQCSSFMSGWDYVFWIEDIVPVTNSDYDFEDVVIRVKVSANQITIDVWHGEHAYTEYVYWKNTLVVQIPSRSAARYNLAYVGTWTFPYP